LEDLCGQVRVTGELPDDDGWTGAEIKSVAGSVRLKLTLKESAEYLSGIPFARTRSRRCVNRPPGIYQRVLPWRIPVPGVRTGTARGRAFRGLES